MIRQIAISFSCLFLLSNCVDSIAPILGETQQFLVIEGEITDDGRTPFIRVLQSADLSLDERGLPTPIPDAQITLYDDAGNEFTPVYDSGYYNFPNLVGQVGRSYQATVEYQGETYSSNWETLLPVSAIDTIKAVSYTVEELSASENIVTRSRYRLLVTTQISDDSENVYYKWNTTGEYKFTDAAFFPFVCYISVNLNKNNVSIF